MYKYTGNLQELWDAAMEETLLGAPKHAGASQEEVSPGGKHYASKHAGEAGGISAFGKREFGMAARRAERARKQQEAAEQSGEATEMAEVANSTQYAIRTFADGRQYVEESRKVLHGNNPVQWRKQIIAYINDEIRNGNDVTVYAADGTPLTITRDTAGKAAFRNDVVMADGTKRAMTDEEYAVKLRAEGHIDELAQASRLQRANVPDRKNHPFAKDGFDYRTAYWKDSTGYYKLDMSVGKNGTVNTVYNVGRIKKAQFPGANARRSSKAQVENKADNIVPQSADSVNGNIQLSSRTQTESEAFKRWFGNSKVVNEDGTPKVMYHGTATEFWTFEKRKANDALGRRMGLGAGKGKFYLSEYEGVGKAAADSAKSLGKGKAPKVMELYVSAQKVMDRSEYERLLANAFKKHPGSDPSSAAYDYKARDKAIAEVDKQIRKEGYDGVWDRDSGEMFVYESTQIKSATDNVGTFDPENPDIRYSTRTPTDTLTIREYLGEMKPTARMNETEKILLKHYHCQKNKSASVMGADLFVIQLPPPPGGSAPRWPRRCAPPRR